MTCTACGTESEPGQKFCQECGQRLSVACPSCGAGIAAEAKFCGECGAPMRPVEQDAAGGTGPQPVPGGGGGQHLASTEVAEATERRLVSVVFVDLVGSTALAEGRDPEDVRATLSEYFDTAAEAVTRHGGVVEKFIGDAVMAVWGTPTAHEDDAERAVRAGLDIVDRVAALGQRLDLPLEARAGVLTGEAVASVDAVDQRLVAGDLVNTAARIQSAAEPGTVLVGERTYRAASNAVAFTPLEPLTVKGKAEPVPAWRADRVVGELGRSGRRTGRGTGPEPPFAGRVEELRLAKDLLHATGREGRPRLVSVTGVAGIGKSRLVWELRKYVDGLTEPVYWHQGRCPAYGEGIAFWALADMVRSRAGVVETDDDEVSRDRLDTYLAGLVTDVEERGWLRPRLGHLLGLDPAPPGGREELFGAWRRFFEMVAAQGTTVLVVEDLQWADPGLLDFLESLLTWSRTSPVLVVTLARPELAEHRPGWGTGVRSSAGLHLDPLPDPEIAAMVTGYVDGIDPADLSRIVQRAEGIPLYAVETVRMLADRGLLDPDGAHYRATAPLGESLQVPETLHALVAARLDALPDDQRALVLDAAVAGQSFTLDTVCAVSGRSPAETEPVLMALVGKEVLDVDADPRSAERGQYRFVQAVIREVAHATLSKPARRSKHLACARWLAGRGEEELAGVIASHYLAAYRAEPSAADAEEISGQATAWLQTAADRAFTLGSPASAHRYAVQALDLAATPAERAALHARAATGAALAGDRDAAWEHYTAAAGTYQALGDTEAEARLLHQLLPVSASEALTEDRRAEVVGVLEDVEARLTAETPNRVHVLADLADFASSRGRRDDALRWSKQALALAQRLHDDDALADAARARAWALFNVDRNFEAALLAEGTLALGRRSGSATSHGGAALVYGIVGVGSDPRAALTVWLESAEVAGRAGIRNTQLTALGNAAEVAIDLGELDTATHALDTATETGIPDGMAREGLALGRAQLDAYRGNVDAAASALSELDAERRSTWTGDMSHTWFLRVRSAVRLIDGNTTGALADAQESIAIDASGGNADNSLWQGVQAAARLGDTDALTRLLHDTDGLRGEYVETVRAVGEATLTALAGQHDTAAQAFRHVLQRWQDQTMPVNHALTAGIAAHVLPEDLAPQADIDTARTRMTELGAHGLLRLL